MWKAHVLISTINARRRRESGEEMAVIYTANTAGQYLPASAAQGYTVGGLARMASVIARLRNEYPLRAVIDAGNFLTPASLPVKARIADWYFRQCKYDAVALGKNEFDFGLERMFDKKDPMNGDYCCTNGSGLPDGRIVRTKTISVKSYSLYVMAVVGPAQPHRPQDRALLAAPLSELTELLAKPAAKKAAVRVLIVNDSWERVGALARSLPEIDVILCGALNQKFEAPMKLGNAIALSPGYGGSCVGVLTLRFNGHKRPESADNHLYELTDDIPPDLAVAAKLRSAIETRRPAGPAALETAIGAMAKSSTEGVFAFMSNRARCGRRVPENAGQTSRISPDVRLARMHETDGFLYRKRMRVF